MVSSTSNDMSKGYIERLRLCWTGWRNRVLAAPRFQQFATDFWLTRPVARARARRTFDLVAGFVYSQTLTACLETGLFDVLADGPTSIDRVAMACRLSPDGALCLLRAGAALGLVERIGDVWMLGSTGAALRGNPGIAEMVAHHRLLYADLADPVALLRRDGGGGALAHYWAYAEHPGQGTPADVSAYSRLMAESQPLVARQILRSYRFSRHRRMLDVGGGEGRFLESVGARVPGLDLALFDLPAVGAQALTRLAAAGLAGRTAIHGGDFLVDPLPRGYDLITLVRVLHDHDDIAASALLRAIHAALPPGGRLLIAEPMAGTRGAVPAGDAYFGLYLLAMGSGRPRTAREIHDMLHVAGFEAVRTLGSALPLTCRVIVARRSTADIKD
ncbi:acetylserotonin O-methyltransferase [Sphingomonas sp. CARO-RG-8B-R24-01]|uniref:acetylserotonin O-methyltransferase n=1 Tax=Sphingomonas sp. CARO-RG-8B-R24-01 TaxID=2914831 RepID=UPI001F577901|nr:acetylserotonin O-methyltransferase [Sphingomonas sp. CARO-RG-8B-R24-01]